MNKHCTEYIIDKTLRHEQIVIHNPKEKGGGTQINHIFPPKTFCKTMVSALATCNSNDSKKTSPRAKLGFESWLEWSNLAMEPLQNLLDNQTKRAR